MRHTQHSSIRTPTLKPPLKAHASLAFDSFQSTSGKANPDLVIVIVLFYHYH